MPDPLLVLAVILVTEAGIVATHVHRNDPAWQEHILNYVARWFPSTKRPITWIQCRTLGLNLDLLH